MPNAIAPEMTLHTQTNVPLEIELTATRDFDDAFNEVAVDLVVTDPAGVARRVPAFWAGGRKWKARYASPLAGDHRWRSEAPANFDAGLHGLSGTFSISLYEGNNPLFQRGPVRAKLGQRHLEYGDGSPFFWLGDTWWTGLSHRLQWPHEFQLLANDRAGKGFNVVQLVAGLYPDMHPFDPRGANEAGFPWEKDYARIRPEYFDAVDLKLRYLVDSGITPCLVGAWGFFLHWMGLDKMKAHWRYLIARYGAWPMLWCAAGEGNLSWYLSKGFPQDDRSIVPGWTEILRYIRATDPFRRPVTIHPTGLNRLTARHVTDDPNLLDFDFLQTPHGERGVVPLTLKSVRESYAETPILAVINGEPAYEMLFDRLGAEWSRATFWLSSTNGTKGHTYGANGIWQLNRPNDPHGPSPHHTTKTGYGVIPWEESMRLPGSQQVAWGKKFLETLPWTELVPMPATVSWAGKSMSNWVWAPADDAAPAPSSVRFFRRNFEVPGNAKILSSTLSVSAADKFTAWLNGTELAQQAGAPTPRPFQAAVTPVAGRNVLAIRTESTGSPFVGNSAGFAAALILEFSDGENFEITADNSWRASAIEFEDWRETSFDDSAWGAVTTSTEDPLFAPQACGIGQALRLIYVIEARPIVLRDLIPNERYLTTHFDPVTGVRTPIDPVVTDAQGEALVAPPGEQHDWVLLLEAGNQASATRA